MWESLDPMGKNGEKNGRKRKFPLLFLGIDGGGTKTNAVILNASKDVLAQGEAGPSNPLRVGVETAVSNIIKATEDACDRAGLIANDISAATLGLAGVRRRDIRERVKAIMSNLGATTMKDMGRMNMKEMCQYEVKDGKIISERFYY